MSNFVVKKKSSETSIQMSSKSKLLTVSEAVAQRRACRYFLPKDVSIKLVKQILNEARTAPSNGNTQPSKVYLVHGETRNKLCQIIRKKVNTIRAIFNIIIRNCNILLNIRSILGKVYYSSWIKK